MVRNISRLIEESLSIAHNVVDISESLYIKKISK